ncbi:MAG: DEAD/DEAH box helicase [Bacteroidales bacterium]|nr:DEAD/DEAH box helicase [Bacteroidales bacterium]
MVYTVSQNIVFALVDHRAFGYVIIPYYYQFKEGSTYFSVNEQVIKENINNNKILPEEHEIINIIDEYSEKNIFKAFSKEKTSKLFYDKLSPEFIQQRIRPFIEKRLYKVVSLISKNNFKLYYKEKKYNTIHVEDEVLISKNSAEPLFYFERIETETLYSLSITIADKELQLLNKASKVITNSPCIMVIDNILYFIKDIDSLKLKPFFIKKNVSIPKSSELKYFESFVLNAVKNFEVKVKGFEIKEINPQKTAMLSIAENLKLEPVLFLDFIYNEQVVSTKTKQQTYVSIKSTNNVYCFLKFKRDKEWENRIIETLINCELKFYDNYFVLNNNFTEFYGYINWFNQYEKTLQKEGIVINPKYQDKIFYKGQINIDFNITYNNDWFDVNAIVKFDKFELPFINFKNYILNGIREFILPNDEIVILPEEWFAKYKNLYQFGNCEKGVIRIKKHHFKLINDEKSGINNMYLVDLNKINDTEKISNISLPLKLKAELRNYQKQGYKWMVNLQKNHLGGCLADDMGLGKTVQTLAVLQYSKDTIERKFEIKSKPVDSNQLKLFSDEHIDAHSSVSSPTSLIVVPTSLLHNWENEIKKFTTSLRIYLFTGMGRTRQQYDFQYYDIVLTTYGVVRNDIDLLKNFYFHYVILDESQIVKNPASKIYKAVICLQSEYKLVLTGTPIENSLTDLWAQLNFVNRGILGNLSFFNSEFVNPIEKLNNVDEEERLHLLIRPYILRRKKEEVAVDLPPVTEQIVFCDLPEPHMKYYEEEKAKIRNLILENIDKQGLRKSSVFILEGLSKLRQLANHPIMIDPLYSKESGKFNEIIRNLENIISEGHKLLMFSSYIKHLEIYKNYLDLNKIEYSYLTGETINRKEVIEEFQNNKNIKVFLITLKAGGVGLNLTAADYVFIIDPWWNPAAEEQAISRAHRIGQNKNVFVYRFISSKTIEEKIQTLKEKKSGLANLFINSNNPFKGIDEKKIKQLFD